MRCAWMSGFLAGLSLLAAAGDGVAGGPPEIGSEKGQMYPDFLLPRLDGGELRLSAYRGKKVVLLHFASW